MREKIEEVAQQFDDVTALDNKNWFANWKAGEVYEAGLKLRYNDV